MQLPTVRLTISEIGDDLERPDLTGAVEFEHLLRPLQIVLLVAAGYADVTHRAPVRLFFGTEYLRVQIRQVVSIMAPRRLLRTQSTRSFSSTQCRNRHTQRLLGLT